MHSIYNMSRIMKLMGDNSRLTMLAILREKEFCGCELVELTGLTQSNISQHLSKLKAAGLVNEIRKGFWTYYSLNIEDKPYVQDVLRYIPPINTLLKLSENNSKGKISCE
jgi:ArsR family transcriptional regulator